MSKSQYGRPFVLAGEDLVCSVPRSLDPIDLQGRCEGRFDEAWLQNVIFRCPELIPVREIDPSYYPLIPVCRELPTEAGFLDALFVNADGMLTVVECKLWRNPQARREVIGQILDYAKELSRWSYDDLQKHIYRALGTNGDKNRNILFDIAKEADENIEEVDFVDNVSRNLKQGKFLLLILGDGIREGVVNITNFLQQHSGLHFTFSLVEMGVYGFPEGTIYRYLFQPRVLARTEVLGRTVIQIEGGMATVVAPQATQAPPVSRQQVGRRMIPSDEEFYTVLSAVDPEATRLLPEFLDRCHEIGLETGRGSKSRMLYWLPEDFGKINFGSCFSDGTVNTNYICGVAQGAGDVSIGERYLEQLANLLGGYSVLKEGKPWTWTVRKGKQYPTIKECLAIQDQWLALIQDTMDAFMKLNDR